MGKPFTVELTDLSTTYHWAMSQKVDRLTALLGDIADLPLLTIGSGGSLSAAHLAVLLHQQHGKIAKAVTPLDLCSTASSPISQSAVLFLSAGGSNPDILSSFHYAAISEPRRLIGLCLNPGSPMRGSADNFRYIDFFDYALPCGKDGFLATNSLLAFFVLLIRGYSSRMPEIHGTLPDQLSQSGDAAARLSAEASTVLIDPPDKCRIIAA